MNYCKRCVYPANHPLNIIFDDQGVCSGCRVHEEKDTLDWGPLREKLGRIFEAYRDKSGRYYDCVVPVTGGQDSYFITHVVTKEFGLNPLLVTYNHEYNTKRGIRNLANLLTVFDCDHINYTVDPESLRKITRHTLREMGSMYWHVQAGMLTFPVQAAVKFRIPLIVWGVNGWLDQVGMFSHLDEVEMTKRVRKEHALMCRDAETLACEAAGVTRRDLQPFVYPFDDELEMVGVRGIYLGNYIRWDSKAQHEQMIDQYGYETAVQQRTFNTYEDIHCFHSAGVHDYIKFLKYGYGKATDHASREIRLKRMTREQGIEMVAKYDSVVPQDLPMFLHWVGMTADEFHGILDQWRDPRIWKREDGQWVRIDGVSRHVRDAGVEEARLETTGDCRFRVTPSREPDEVEDEYVLMGRGYIDSLNFRAVRD